MRELRAKHKNRQRKERKLINPVTTPQYDDTYYEIITWLDLKSLKRSIKNEALNNTQIWTASSW